MNNTQIIAVANQKGGVGKTTTTFNTCTSLARKGKKVLLVDLDPQASLTLCAGYSQTTEFKKTITDLIISVMNEDVFPKPSDYLLEIEGCDLIPSSILLSGVEPQMVSAMSRETILKKILHQFIGEYDYIFVDCNPNLGMLTINALVACTSVLIPLQAHILGAEGLGLLLQTISRVKRNINFDLKIEGILFTMHNPRLNISKDVVKEIKQAYEKHLRIFENTIPQSVKAIEPTAEGKSAYEFLPTSKVSEAYEAFTKELLEEDK